MMRRAGRLQRSWGGNRHVMALLACGAGLAMGVMAAPQAWARGDEGDAATSATTTATASERVRIGRIDIEGALVERLPELAAVFGSSEEKTLRSVIDAIDGAADDDSIQGLLLRLKDAELSSTQVEEIGSAITRFRASGKKVHVFSDAFGPMDFKLGSYADEVMAQAGGGVMLPGMYMEEMFLADTLAWAGVKADFVQVGDYKGASEMLARNSPSPQWDQNINQLLDSMYANLTGPMMAGRKLSSSQMEEAMSQLWLAQTEDAKKAGLVDSVIDLPEMPAHFRTAYGKPVSWKNDLIESEGPALDMSNPFAMLGMFAQKPDYSTSGPTIGVVHIDGAIIDGESTSGGFGGSPQVGSRTIRNTLEDLRRDENIKGVILRINSPGGSATASEVIWQGVRRLGEEKPVWVSVGSMAASGGYYIAVSGAKIYANPSSIVGSIGVVGGKLSMQELYKNLRINVVGRARGPRAEMMGSNRDWSPQDIAAVKAKMTQTYEQFTSRVKAGRPQLDLAKTAEGRLFTGDKALDLKMVDKVGGIDVAIADFAKELGLGEGFDVKDYPAPRALEDVLKEAFGGIVQAPGMAAPQGHATLGRAQVLGVVREVLGPDAYAQVEAQLQGLLQLREQRVLLMSPRALIFK